MRRDDAAGAQALRDSGGPVLPAEPHQNLPSRTSNLVGLPSALLPLWQVAQLPAATPAWLKVAVAQDVVELWQVLHWAVVAICVAGLVCAFWLT